MRSRAVTFGFEIYVVAFSDDLGISIAFCDRHMDSLEVFEAMSAATSHVSSLLGEDMGRG